jgi:hypothetical protein
VTILAMISAASENAISESLRFQSLEPTEKLRHLNVPREPLNRQAVPWRRLWASLGNGLANSLI